VDEQRQQAYLQLVQELLACEAGQEAEILADWQDLVDEGLVTTVLTVAKMLEDREGQDAESTIKWLVGFAQNLSGQLRVDLGAGDSQGEMSNDSEEQLRFLLEVLQSIDKNNGDPHVIYPLLHQNLGLLNDGMIMVLRAWVISTLAEAEKDDQKYIVGLVGEFGNLIQQFPLGNKAVNMDLSIAGYEAAMEVYTKQDFPLDWAMTQNNRAIVYSNRIRGDRAENLENAIAGYKAAVEVYTKQDFPLDWAMTQNNRANAYNDRIRGDRAENLENAITGYEAALEIRTKENFPIQWATTRNNLATAYLNRIRGDRAENLENAIAGYEAALEIYTKQDFPLDWAMTQNNRANVYLNRIRGDRAENLESAIAGYEAALEIRTKENFPIQWATTQNNLANVYSDRIKGDKAENLEKAIVGYEAALEIYTKQDFPLDWAMMQNNLANVYSQRIKGDGAENLEQAIEGYEAALEVRTFLSLPLDCLQTARNLGNIHFTQGNWQRAIYAYETAIEAAETSRSWAIDEEERQRIIREALSVYENTIQAQINLGQIGAAIVTTERARSRQLVDFMASNDLYSNAEIPFEVQEYLQEYEQLQQAIQRLIDFRPEDKELDNTNSRSDLQFASAKIRELESQKQQIWKKIRQLDPTLAEQKQVSLINIATIQSLATTSSTAILSFYTTDDDTHIFIIRPDQDPQIHTCFGQGWATLQRWLAETWLGSYTTDRQEWFLLIPEILAELANRLKIQELIEKLPDIQELVLIPHLYLHQIPFSALPISESNDLFSDKFTIRYAPSCQILRSCLERPEDKVVRHGIIENADGTLPGTVYECQGIAALFNVEDSYHLQGRRQSTLAQFQSIAHSVTDLHISSHAFSRLDSPLETSLKFADGSLTLDYLLISRYPKLQEVFLSCCETHLGNTTITDDLLTLGTGFLCAGARTVFSSLWAVNDIATALFCRLYYQNHYFGDNRSLALQKAQTSLRLMSGEEFQLKHSQDLKTHLVAYAKANKADRRALQTQKDQGEIKAAVFEIQQGRLLAAYEKAIELIGLPGQPGGIDQFCRTTRPFEHPYYWAGFICQGLA
jgi:CHAT domain-containing protein